MRKVMAVAVFGVLTISAGFVSAQGDLIKIEQVMTSQEMQETGIESLTPIQRRALDGWLNRYTLRVLQVSLKPEPRIPNAFTLPAGSPCSPAIETRMAGDIEGWDGDTIFKLDNGQIWQQSSYAYTYFYAYRPEVTIYQTGSGCRMKVGDRSDTVAVRRIK